MEWLKKNPALATGIALPLLLVLFFLFASWLPQFFVTPPQYGVLFATNYYDSSEGIIFEVKDKKLKAHFKGLRSSYYTRPRLYRYDAARGELKEILFEIPDSVPEQPENGTVSEEQRTRITPVPIPEAESITLYTPETAPDGYNFSSGGYYRGTPFFSDIFYSSSRRDYSPSLHKQGNLVKIRLPADDISTYNMKFLGWIE